MPIITSIRGKIDYIVPSFPVFEAKLRHIRYTYVAGSGTVYDGFMREEGDPTPNVNSTLRICNGHTNAFFIPLKELCRSVDIDGKELTACTFVDEPGDEEEELFVAWKWTKTDDDTASNKGGIDWQQSPELPANDADTESNMDRGPEEDSESVSTVDDDSNIHSVVFMCIDST